VDCSEESTFEIPVNIKQWEASLFVDFVVINVVIVVIDVVLDNLLVIYYSELMLWPP